MVEGEVCCVRTMGRALSVAAAIIDNNDRTESK
jgi:hypothetical protein